MIGRAENTHETEIWEREKTMCAALIGKHTGRQICAALGIESGGLRRLELIADKDAVTTVRTERIVYDDQLERLVALLTEYRVEAIDSHREPIGHDPYDHRGSTA